MWQLVVKGLLSGILVILASEVAKRYPSLGALIISLPLLSVLTMVWLWHDTHDVERLATHSASTFWLVLPSLPMFLLIPWLLRHGIAFYLALGISCAITFACYLLMVWALSRYGIKI